MTGRTDYLGILRYAVKLDSRNPMYGMSRLLKDFGANKDEAIRWAKTHGKTMGADADMVYVEEAEFCTERNLRQNLPMYRRHIWSAAFHGYE